MRRFFVFAMLLFVGCQPATRTVIPSTPSLIVDTHTPPPTETPSPQPTATPSPTPPATVPAAMIELAGAQLPPGFSLLKFADLYRPTGFAFDTLGRLYVTSQDGNVYILHDKDGDGRAESRTTFATGYYFPLGVAIHDLTGEIYVSSQGEVAVLRDTDEDDRADQERILVDDLPFDRHQNDNLEFGPDGWLYIGVGSSCDACVDPDPRGASILRFNVDTGESEIYATGLRNPFDIAFHPDTHALFATDNGRDDLGLEAPFEELNHIVFGGDYGYPDCWNEQRQGGCEDSLPAIAFFEPHSSANGLDIYDGSRFPTAYHGNAFVSIFGSWLKPGVQTGVQHVILLPAGNTYTTQSEWFLQFPEGVMPLPLLFGPDDAMYVGDYINDVIYRVSYGIP